MVEVSTLQYVVLAIIFQGLTVGGILALGASSLTIIYGGVRFPNVALGSFLVLGAYTASGLTTGFNLDFFAAMGVGVVPFLLLFFLLDAVLFRRYYRDPDPALRFLLITLGLFIAIDGIYDNLIPRDPVTLITSYSRLNYNVAGFTVTAALMVALVLEYLILLSLLYFMRYSRHGRALRAMVQDKEAAALMGVDVVGMSRTAFMISSVVATVTGMIYALVFSFDPSVAAIGITIIVMVLVGGAGSVLGSTLVGLLFGFVEAVVTFSLSPILSVFFFYGILFLSLLLKPQGLFTR